MRKIRMYMITCVLPVAIASQSVVFPAVVNAQETTVESEEKEAGTASEAKQTVSEEQTENTQNTATEEGSSQEAQSDISDNTSEKNEASDSTGSDKESQDKKDDTSLQSNEESGDGKEQDKKQDTSKTSNESVEGEGNKDTKESENKKEEKPTDDKQADNKTSTEPDEKTSEEKTNLSGLADGEYILDKDIDIYVSGGGRHRPVMHCERVIIKSGKAFADVLLESGTYGFATVEDDFTNLNNGDNKKDVNAAEYKIAATHPSDSTSLFTIPVNINEDTEFCAWSDNVNSWISPYKIRINVKADDIKKEENNSKSEYKTDTSSEKTQTPDKSKGNGNSTESGGKTDNNKNSDKNSNKNNNSGSSGKSQAEATSKPAVLVDERVSVIKPLGEDIIDNGTYTVLYRDVPSTRMNIIGVVLKANGGAYTADITLNGTGYGYVYPGTSAQAKAASMDKWSPAWLNGAGKYTYTITVPYLDKPFTLAARSVRDAVWYDNEREMIIYSSDVYGNRLPTHKGTRNTTQQSTKGSGATVAVLTAPGATGVESSSSSRGGGVAAVSAIDSSTGLKDGIYTPDSFSWSGGAGHINITCDQVIVRDGKTFARITISSAYYTYVKAGGQTVTDVVHGPSSSTFVIPVELNKNNSIAACTTKLSKPYEIGYTIYVGLNAALEAGQQGTAVKGASQDAPEVDKQYDELDKEGPVVTGLKYESETEIKYSDLIKIFNYEDGYKLIELDVTKGKALDPEWLKENGIDTEELKEDEENKDNKEKKEENDKENSEEEKSKDTNSEDVQDEDDEESIEEQKSGLYKNNVIKYLLVPQDKEVPAGMDKKCVIIKQASDKAAVASKEALALLEDMELIDSISGIAIPEKDIENESIKKALEEYSLKSKEKNKDKDSDKDRETDKLIPVGTYDKPDFKKLILAGNNVLIEDSAIIPKQEDGTEDSDKKEAENKGDDKEVTAKSKEELVKRSKEALKAIEAFYKIGKLGTQIELGVFVDRSADEENELAKAEWYKVYGAIFDKDNKAKEIYDSIVSKATDKEKQEALEAVKKDDDKNNEDKVNA